MALLFGVVAESGAQTVIHLYRAGENDGGASNGAALGATTTDGVGSTTLNRLGTGGTYTSATSVPGSSLAFDFSGTSNLVGATDTTLTSGQSFFMETWFNADTVTGTKALVYNGDTGSSGIGLYVSGSKITVLAGGSIFSAGNINFVSGAWNHAALVYDAGSVRLYLNGALDLSMSGSFSNPGSGGLSIGGSGSGNERFLGAIDHVRIAGFNAGNFNTSMLSYSPIPEPSTYAAIFGAAALGLAAWRRRRAA